MLSLRLFSLGGGGGGGDQSSLIGFLEFENVPFSIKLYYLVHIDHSRTIIINPFAFGY